VLGPIRGQYIVVDRPINISSTGSSPRTYSKGKTVTLRKEIVDHGPDPAPSSLYILEEPS
jgi:hypothetical protein